MGRVTAVVPAAGKGLRMGLESPGKQFADLGGKPVLAHTLTALAAAEAVDGIIVVTGKEQIPLARRLVQDYPVGKVHDIVPGGDTRQESVRLGLSRVPCDTEIVVVHDGARPLVEPVLVNQVIEAAREYGAAGAAVPVKDTIKVSDEAGFVISTPSRDRLWAIQTPQAFRCELLKEAHRQAQAQGYEGTDDCMLVEKLGRPVKLVLGSYRNIKLTTPEDMIIAAALLEAAAKGQSREDRGPMPRPRVGWGYDVHQLVEGRPLILGGVAVPHEKGLLGHSDADVLLHAVMDALLGALALGDIGQYFPDTDPKWRGASSLELLRQVGSIIASVQTRKPVISHIDCVIIAERPRLAAHIPQMRRNIAEALQLDIDQVSIKATTSEGLGPAGRGEGIIAQAAALVLA
ncbi:MAG TPA: 2-C-methyl-D-erythritol 4-phosphate cytidylyltransferase [Firmicutes bacterium]|nr:2-C-methyl-D-erythritol 4-phosphate cytidylyltransferase [Bacillota bacterium]